MGTHGEKFHLKLASFLKQNNWRSSKSFHGWEFQHGTNGGFVEVGGTLTSIQKEKKNWFTVTRNGKNWHFFDERNQRIFVNYKHKFSNNQITQVSKMNWIGSDFKKILSLIFDGGMRWRCNRATVGFCGTEINLESRPAYYYADDEVIVVVWSKLPSNLHSILISKKSRNQTRAMPLVVNQGRSYLRRRIMPAREKKSCKLWANLFFRGTDPVFYQGGEKIFVKGTDPSNSESDRFWFEKYRFLPHSRNTAETAFLGWLEGLEDYLSGQNDVRFLFEGNLIWVKIWKSWLNFRPRVEKLLVRCWKTSNFHHNDGRPWHDGSLIFMTLRMKFD